MSFLDVFIIFACFCFWISAGHDNVSDDRMAEYSWWSLFYSKLMFICFFIIFASGGNDEVEALKCFLLSIFLYIIHTVNHNCLIGREMKRSEDELKNDVDDLLKNVQKPKREGK